MFGRSPSLPISPCRSLSLSPPSLRLSVSPCACRGFQGTGGHADIGVAFSKDLVRWDKDDTPLYSRDLGLISRASQRHALNTRASCSCYCPCLSDADWCLQSDVITESRLQLPRRRSPRRARRGARPQDLDHLQQGRRLSLLHRRRPARPRHRAFDLKADGVSDYRNSHRPQHCFIHF